ncbi:hypothetical protein B0A55_04333 [Friedmanniomyces simplex]|uniref:Killer toxin Kp4 domain-containing protein n=1 Tax=Friedmanniomyces simplex TaxID=329884 RepID=A0A4U0XLD2_9PEZI|nr:hypothetical protein B0A55_04333 [Friedmanniomyces simplex]
MKLPATTAALVLATVSVAAVAVKNRDEGGPTPICVYMTNDYNWKGEGMNFCKVGGQCGSGLGPHLMKNVSSAGPPKGQTCFLYDGIDCTGHGSPPIVYPGYMNLSDAVINFDKRAQSWRCWKHCGYMGSSVSSSSMVTKSSKSSKAPAMVTTTVTASQDHSSVSQGAAITTVFSLTQGNHGVTVVTQTLPAPSKASTVP